MATNAKAPPSYPSQPGIKPTGQPQIQPTGQPQIQPTFRPQIQSTFQPQIQPPAGQGFAPGEPPPGLRNNPELAGKLMSAMRSMPQRKNNGGNPGQFLKSGKNGGPNPGNFNPGSDKAKALMLALRARGGK